MYANQIYPQRRATFVSEWLISRDCSSGLEMARHHADSYCRLQKSVCLAVRVCKISGCQPYIAASSPSSSSGGEPPPIADVLPFALSEVNHIRCILVIAGLSLCLVAGLPQVGIGLWERSPAWRRRPPHHPRTC